MLRQLFSQHHGLLLCQSYVDDDFYLQTIESRSSHSFLVVKSISNHLIQIHPLLPYLKPPLFTTFLKTYTG